MQLTKQSKTSLIMIGCIIIGLLIAFLVITLLHVDSIAAPRMQRVGNSTDTLGVYLLQVSDGAWVGGTEPRGLLRVYDESAAAKAYVESDAANAEIIVDSGPTSTSYVRFQAAGSTKGYIGYNASTDTWAFTTASGKVVFVAGDDISITSSGDIEFDANEKVTVSDTLITDLGIKFSDGSYMTSAGVVGVGGWTDDGTIIRLTTLTDNVSIGKTSARGQLLIYKAADDAEVYIESDSTEAILFIDAGGDDEDQGDGSIKFMNEGALKSQITHEGDANVLQVLNTSGNIYLNGTGYITLGDTVVTQQGIKFNDDTRMSTLAPNICGGIVDGLQSATQDSITIWPNVVNFSVSFDSIAVISDTDDETFELRISPIKGGVHTVIGTVTTSLDLDDGRFHGSISSFTDDTIIRGQKVYLLVPTTAEYAEIYIYTIQ